MNYLNEMNAFYAWLETNSVPASGISLWHALMQTCNKARWVVEFAVAISTLESKTGLKKDAIIRARQRLKQLNRIDFRSRDGQQSAIYIIKPFFSYDCVVISDTKHWKSDCVVLNDTNRNTNRALSATQTASIIKLNGITDDEMIREKPRAPDDGKSVFCGNVYLTWQERNQLADKLPRNDRLRVSSFIANLSKAKTSGYIPEGSDFDELLRVINEEIDRAAGS